MDVEVTNHYRIMAVDDEQSVLDLYKYILCGIVGKPAGPTGNYSFELTMCKQGNEAVEAAGTALEMQNPFSVIFLDLNIPPGMDGVWTAEQIQKLDPNVNIVLVTGYMSTNLGEGQHLTSNADKVLYLQKPFHPQEIWQLATALSAKWRAENEYRNLRLSLDSLIQERAETMLKKNRELGPDDEPNACIDIDVRQLAVNAEKKDVYFIGHQKRVARLAREIAREIGLSDQQQEWVHSAGLIHDIGKISVPSEILCKPAKLDQLEIRMVQYHSQVGYDMLKGLNIPQAVSMTVHQHHERMNGIGYPRGLMGEHIIPEARVLAIADVIDAMVSERPHRPAMAPEKAVDEILSNRGILYDAAVVDACVALIERNGYDVFRS
jgi:putative two-component system response regulator